MMNIADILTAEELSLLESKLETLGELASSLCEAYQASFCGVAE